MNHWVKYKEMKVIELLEANKSLLELMEREKMNPSDVKYIRLYEEYLRMKSEGHKLTYIVAFLVDEYQVGQATVYRIIERFGKLVKVN